MGQEPAAGSPPSPPIPAPRRPAQPPPALRAQRVLGGRNARGLQAGVIARTPPGPLPSAAGLRAARDPAGRASPPLASPGDRSPRGGSCAG